MDMPAMVEIGIEYRGKDDVTSNDNVGSSTACIKDSCNDNNEEEPPQKRIVHHRRKGIPQCAPFF